MKQCILYESCGRRDFTHRGGYILPVLLDVILLMRMTCGRRTADCSRFTQHTLMEETTNKQKILEIDTAQKALDNGKGVYVDGNGVYSADW